MNMRILDGVIGILDRVQKDISDSTNKIEKLQTNLNQVQKEKENIEKELQTLRSSTKGKEEDDFPKEFLSLIPYIKNSKSIDEHYQFLNEISEEGTKK
ncbi:hypothetical protein TVAG_389800 [Trichomonas vaginalis G3]|uniref:DUF4515 domain-containing protein n=1 Tax=Trichomonas vaginalis (strain ATCC PRA-98 / G3) TaxID=412133 RepID=A2E182_TRIV3|nr:hypothetical protein TVAG_389800 [Trichomonas vaginalis G3]|eukprot:XP_001325806.1 hypothetical protein [Trichomonas vaginalis G3]